MSDLIDLVPIEFRQKMVAGVSFRERRGEATFTRYHIRAVVDEGMLVVRYWNQHGQQWCYKVEDIYFFYLMDESDRISDIKPSPK